MRTHAMASGDQPFGAVLVAANDVVADGPSRVVAESDPDAHAERVAIREAQRILGTQSLAGAVLYSTSRPCRLCEHSAAEAGVMRMYVGPQLLDAGAPRPL
jgi:tRNA(Arg) A34 adenosine deaminase TadA